MSRTSTLLLTAVLLTLVLLPFTSASVKWKVDHVCKVNQIRATHGLPPLQLDDNLDAYSDYWSKQQKDQGKMSHDGADGSKPWSASRIPKFFKTAYSSVAENVAWGSNNADSTLDQWVNSEGHLRNMLGDYTRMGVGNEGLYWTQSFAKVSGDQPIAYDTCGAPTSPYTSYKSSAPTPVAVQAYSAPPVPSPNPTTPPKCARKQRKSRKA